MSIPGLELLSFSESEEGGLELGSFTGRYRVPEAHRDGKCRSYTSFEKLSLLGEGTFGKIYKCRDSKDENIVTLKKYENLCESESMFASMLNEIKILSNLKHINIVNLLETVAGKKLDCFYLVLDFCQYSLAVLIDGKCDMVFEPPVIKFIMKNICEGLAYIHRCKVIHRDICCQNIMFNEDGMLKIASFENCHCIPKENMPPFDSSNWYRAPELLFGAKTYGSPVDMWSTGCIFAELLQKKPIFDVKSVPEALKKMVYYLGVPSDSIWPGFSKLPVVEKMKIKGQSYSNIRRSFNNLGHPKVCCDFLESLLIYYPEARLTAEKCLEDKYFFEEPNACSLEDMAVKLNSWHCNNLSTS